MTAVQQPQQPTYAARLDIDYPDRNLNRMTTAFLVDGATGSADWTEGGRTGGAGGSIAGGLFLATVLMIVFRQVYPRWWFDFQRELC
jgi:hypothetical protein